MAKEIQGYIINFFKRIREGRYGPIFECKRQNCQELFFAEKIIALNNQEAQYYENILAQIKNNPSLNLLQIYDVLHIEGKFLIIISESYQQTLEEYLNYCNDNPLDESEIENILLQLVDGYLHLRKLQIIYGGIDFQNIVFKTDNQKLIFKLAPSKNSILELNVKPKTSGLKMSGLFFRAPELLNLQNVNQISEKTDIYSFGLLILRISCPSWMSELISSIPQLKKFQNDLKEQKFSWPDAGQKNKYSEKFKQKILSMIAYNPSDRCKWISLQMPNVPQIIEEPKRLVNQQDIQNFDQCANNLIYSIHNQNQSNILQLDNQQINKVKMASEVQQIQGETKQSITDGNHSATTIIDYTDDDFEVYKHQVVGKGNQGTVYKAKILKTGEEIVAKQVSGLREQYIERESAIFQLLKYKKHENLVKFFHKGTDKYSDFIFLEKCDKNLTDYKEKIVEDSDIIEFIKQITMGYLFLIQNQIIHRDLKPDNIMIKQVGLKPVYKLIDFGVGKELSEDMVTQTYVGTPMYQAPEVFNREKHNHQCDVFSFGMIIYEILFKGNILKDKKVRQDVRDFHNQIKYNNFKCPPYKNSHLTDLIEKMIVYDCNQRIKWKEILYHQIFNFQS